MQEERKCQNGRRFYIIRSLVLAIIILGIILLCRGCSKTPDASIFNGTYYIDDYTAYEFDGKGKGAMCLGDTTRYVFDYSVKDDILSLDFEDVRINDTSYTFILNGDARYCQDLCAKLFANSVLMRSASQAGIWVLYWI